MLASAAAAALLRGALTLAQRRGAFVSAVTHELRTPLTTFRMYVEMLRRGMVTSQEKRDRYLQTLQVEADRLSHLVENVLAYARLGRRGNGARIERHSVGQLLDQVHDRLTQRALQAGMDFSVHTDDAVRAAHVRADASAVEQILYNLVDNACKYATSATVKSIHLQATCNAKAAELRVRDRGPGISKDVARHLFRPFSKSAEAAADSAPGIGLGLALSRRYARNMGATLTLENIGGNHDGACFVLTLRRR